MSHTPAPWNSEMDAGEWIGIEAVTADGQVRREICVVSVDENYDDDDDSSEQEDRDNARLIAAAPDLLAVCQEWMACWNSPRDMDRIVKSAELIKKTEAAIARATTEASHAP